MLYGTTDGKIGLVKLSRFTNVVKSTVTLLARNSSVFFIVGTQIRAARSPVFYGSSRISGHMSHLPFETNTGDTFSRISTSLNFVA